MSGICSIHRGHDSRCRMCNADIRDVLPDYDEKLARAERAGKVRCACGFVYYRTTTNCPLCNRDWHHGQLIEAGSDHGD